MNTITDNDLMDALKQRIATAQKADSSAFARLAEIDRDAYSALEWAALEIMRQRQDEEWSVEHDDTHDEGEMATAAACYAHLAGEQTRSHRRGQPDRVSTTAPSMSCPPAWPWDTRWWKPKNVHRNLVRAIALLAVEWGRWNRAAIKAYAAPVTPEDQQS